MNPKAPTEPLADRDPSSPVELVVRPRTADLVAGFKVRRALPSMQRRMVGPFIFLDQMGPAVLAPGRGLDVRPHPHIGLATVTYLFEGEVLHRDSLGTVQPIKAGAVNWMTAGRGISHSERTPPQLRETGGRLSGIQTWVALPQRDEEMEPAFAHTPASALPSLEDRGLRVRLIAGSLFGKRSPVVTRSELFYADAALEPGARLEVPASHEERAIFVGTGSMEIEGEPFSEGQLVVLRPGQQIVVSSPERSRLMLLGGAAMDGPRHIWWNLVSSSREQIEQAKSDWASGRFPQVPGETDVIPLPGQEAPVPKYP